MDGLINEWMYGWMEGGRIIYPLRDHLMVSLQLRKIECYKKWQVEIYEGVFFFFFFLVEKAGWMSLWFIIYERCLSPENSLNNKWRINLGSGIKRTF